MCHTAHGKASALQQDSKGLPYRSTCDVVKALDKADHTSPPYDQLAYCVDRKSSCHLHVQDMSVARLSGLQRARHHYLCLLNLVLVWAGICSSLAAYA